MCDELSNDDKRCAPLMQAMKRSVVKATAVCHSEVEAAVLCGTLGNDILCHAPLLGGCVDLFFFIE